MSSIGPSIPAHLKQSRSPSGSPEPGPSIGPQIPAAIGPQIPSSVGPQLPRTTTPTAGPSLPSVSAQDEDDDEDDYAPALPPDLAAVRPAAPARRVLGPSLGPAPYVDDDSDDDVGPAPLPAGHVYKERDAVKEFQEREERRKRAIEDAAKPKALKRDEWMLAPPSSSDLLNNIDPTKMRKARQFSRSTAPPKKIDNTLWTETPAERQQRLTDEVMGKRRRMENAEDDGGGENSAEARKRRKREAELSRQVEDYTKQHRGPSLVDAHEQAESRKKKDPGEGPPGIWDHQRDMATGGRLMDDRDRRKLINDSKDLSSRFGAGTSGGFL
ncbi:hypothetical protein PENSPDRAFT_645094 [Peniophora sp. CONT]|nr:hypothetical protein PENSPDRAFT_645094 [Peniophora sp. CONT]